MLILVKNKAHLIIRLLFVYFLFVCNIVVANEINNNKQDNIINKIKDVNSIDKDNVFLVYNYDIINLLDEKLLSNYFKNTMASYSDPEKSNYKYFNIIYIDKQNKIHEFSIAEWQVLSTKQITYIPHNLYYNNGLFWHLKNNDKVIECKTLDEVINIVKQWLNEIPPIDNKVGIDRKNLLILPISADSIRLLYNDTNKYIDIPINIDTSSFNTKKQLEDFVDNQIKTFF